MNRTTASRMRRVVVMGLALALVACREGEGERMPIGGAQADSGSGTLTAEARASLAAGNEAFRARRYPDALAAYRRAASESPQDVAPLWGMQMAARAMNDSALADSVVARMRELAPTAGPVTGQDPHASGAATRLPPNHPPTTSSGGALPPSHPPLTTVPGVPRGQ